MFLQVGCQVILSKILPICLKQVPSRNVAKINKGVYNKKVVKKEEICDSSNSYELFISIMDPFLKNMDWRTIEYILYHDFIVI